MSFIFKISSFCNIVSFNLRINYLVVVFVKKYLGRMPLIYSFASKFIVLLEVIPWNLIVWYLSTQTNKKKYLDFIYHQLHRRWTEIFNLTIECLTSLVCAFHSGHNSIIATLIRLNFSSIPRVVVLLLPLEREKSQ